MTLSIVPTPKMMTFPKGIEGEIVTTINLKIRRHLHWEINQRNHRLRNHNRTNLEDLAVSGELLLAQAPSMGIKPLHKLMLNRSVIGERLLEIPSEGLPVTTSLERKMRFPDQILLIVQSR